MMKPPVAKKVKKDLEMFGDWRIDNYYWLRDDSRTDPHVLSHLHQENSYTDHIMFETKQLEHEIYSEIRGRLKEDDISAPLRKGPYYYYKRTLEGKEYAQHCRRRVPNSDNVPESVYDTMPIGSDAPPEHVLLDENVKAREHAFYVIGAFKASLFPVFLKLTSCSCFLFSYFCRLVRIINWCAEDIKGDEIYTVYVIDAESRAQVGKPLIGVTSEVEWAGDNALVYTTRDEILRPDKVWLHRLAMEQHSDSCLYHETDDIFSLDIAVSESKKFLFVSSESKLTRFVFYVDLSNPENGVVELTPRLHGIDTSASHCGNHFFIKRRSDESINSEILACPVDNTSDMMVLLPHRPNVNIQEMQLFSNHIVIYERENGLPRIMVHPLPNTGEPLTKLQHGQAVEFLDSIYSVNSSDSSFLSSILRFQYSSMRTPDSVYDYDMNSGISVLKKIEKILGGFDSSNYISERRWSTAPDGTQIPISMVYRKDTAKLDGSDPLLLYGYGSYEGFIFAIAHIRGGGEMGRLWYENGKLFKKKNTFTDFIACAEHLIEKRYCSKNKFCIEGRSAGGLLIGAVLNMRPDLFAAAVAGVPFVDVLTTMLDPSIPLTISEWEEWGDPRKEEFYFYVKSYLPIDNITAQNYPAILITAGLNDTRVLYSEPAKFVAKLRDTNIGDNPLLFKCELGAGHFSKSGRFEKLREDAFTYCFLMKALNMVSSQSEI